MKTVMERIAFYLRQRAGGELETGAVVFSGKRGSSGGQENADKTAGLIESQRKKRRSEVPGQQEIQKQ